MTHYAELQDRSSAVGVAERGINHIGFKDDVERRNIWLAWINLEDYFGDLVGRQTVFER